MLHKWGIDCANTFQINQNHWKTFVVIHNELGKVKKFWISRPLFSWRNSNLKKVRADSAPHHPNRVKQYQFIGIWYLIHLKIVFQEAILTYVSSYKHPKLLCNCSWGTEIFLEHKNILDSKNWLNSKIWEKTECIVILFAKCVRQKVLIFL